MEVMLQASIDLTKLKLNSSGIVDWYDLRAVKGGETVTGLGSIRVGIWLANNEEEEQDHAGNVLASLRAEGGQ